MVLADQERVGIHIISCEIDCWNEWLAMGCLCLAFSL